MKIRLKRQDAPQVASFVSVRDTTIDEQGHGLKPGETTTKPKFAGAASAAGFGYSYAGVNKDYERVMEAIDSVKAPGQGINKNTGMNKNSGIIPIKRPTPRGTIGNRRIQKGYRSRGF
jgi:hypothetical protein